MRRAHSLVCLSLLAAALTPASVVAKNEDLGGWSPAPDLAIGRAQHTATPLRTGRVLVTGGVGDRGVVTATAELFDPKTNRWTGAASMGTPRTDFTASPLRDGRVLVVGGRSARDFGETLASAELYDPVTGRWAPAASMSIRRGRHTATVLPDGRVLVLGGVSVSAEPYLFASFPDVGELYDPLTNTWSRIAPGLSGRTGHTATLLSDGRVLVVGGQGDVPDPSVKLYDPTPNSWSAAPTPRIARFGHTATLLPDGKVLVVGGIGVSVKELAAASPQYPTYSLDPLASGELYDPASDSWTFVVAMHSTRYGHTATLLPGGVLVVGGAYANPGHPDLFEIPGYFWVAGSSVISRHGHTATRLPDGRVLIVGGFGIETMSTAWTYRPDMGVAQVSRWGPLPTALAMLAALAVLLALIWGGGSNRTLRRWMDRRDRDDWIAS